MDILSFQSENPAEIDAFKGGSHDRVATAIHNYLLDDSNHKVIGLDGEFGSGKSSILQMLEKKIIDVDSATKLWLFDCEQNYQGSIKSNFIELLTEQVLKAIPSTAKASVRENVLRNRDIALGRHVSYTKDTRSHISIWAILLIAGGVLSPTLLRDYLSQLHQPDPLALWKHGLYTLGIIFPAITLGLAMFMNRGKGKKKWNLSSILKGSSDDHITETIEISKEVSPLDLKRTLDQHLEAVSGTNFIIVIDNLDRLPREALRAVWSDLEIFTSVSRKQNLSIIVPFCSTKVSKYLNGDNEKSYDSKDFIAKKFPVVFRAPPIITSGWKDAFRTLWTQSFGSLPLEQADVCSLILKRHSPMADGLVTPRLQKRFINDLATTVLVTAGDPKMEVIAAYISICKYNGVPIETLLRAADKTTAEDEDDADGKSEADDPVSSENLRKTRELLSGLYGEDVDSGWPIQILQVHFQTSKDIAIAELIDQPLANAVEAENGKKFVELSSYFGFMDSFNRFLEGQLPVKSLLQTLSMASGIEGFDVSAFTRKVSLRLASDSSLKDIRGDASYYQAIKSLTHFGLNKDLFRVKIDSLASDFDRLQKTSYTMTESSLVEEMILTYDAYLDAVDQPFESRNISSSENLFHHLVGREDLKVIDAAKISLDANGIKDAIKQITATNALPYDMVPLDEGSWESCFIHYFGQLQLKNRDRDFLFSDADVMSIITSLSTDIREDRYWLGLAFYKTYVPQIVSMINSYAGSTTSVRTKLAIASIYLRQGLYDELAGIVGIAEALEESPAFFEALVRATSVNDDLTFACLDPVCAPLIAPLMARLIKGGGIGTVFSSAIHKNYESLVHALQPYGLSEDEFFEWFVSFNLSPSNLPSFKDFDSLALERVLNSDHPKMVTLRDHLFEERFVNLDVQGWSDIIAQSSTLQTVALERMVDLHWPLKNIKPAYDASLSYLTAAAKQPIFIEPPIDQIETLNLVIRLLSDTQRTILGTELRELLYSAPCSSVAGLYLLATFGALIPTFVPVNEVESGRLLQLFSLIGTETPHTSEAASFLDSRHQQLISWAPGELMHTYMELVTKQKDVLPNVYESLSNKKGFKRRMKRLTDALFS